MGARKNSQRSLKYNDSTGILPRYTLAHNKRAGSNKGMITLASQSGLKSHRMASGRKRNSVLNRSSESAQLMHNDAANQFYDKNIGRAFDKFNAQECHQRRLVEIRESQHLRKVNYERLTSGSGRSVSVASNKKFQDNLKRNQVNHRVFNTREQRNFINR